MNKSADTHAFNSKRLRQPKQAGKIHKNSENIELSDEEVNDISKSRQMRMNIQDIQSSWNLGTKFNLVKPGNIANKNQKFQINKNL